MEIKVSLAAKSYSIRIEAGALKRCGDWAASLWSPRSIVLVTDENVDKIYADQAFTSLYNAGFTLAKIVLPAGESSKSLANTEILYSAFLEAGLTRTDGIIALGGGVIGDLVGFCASTYLRGIPLLQIPTTLLAQVDSSVGGKTAVNLKQGKNLVGTFYQPDGVLIDPETLQTLPMRQVREGLAEIIKYAAIADKTLWDQLESFQDESDFLAHSESIIGTCCEIKRQVVEADEFDTGARLLLNFGHTIGHGVEQVYGYGTYNHGEAVAIGMAQLTTVSEKQGITSVGTAARLKALLRHYHLPISASPWEPEKLMKVLVHDKKATGKDLRIIRLREIGQAEIAKIPVDSVLDYLQQEEGEVS